MRRSFDVRALTNHDSTCSGEVGVISNQIASNQLLGPDEPAAYSVQRADGASPFFLICDHAGNRIPRKLEDLGVAQVDLQRHIAWDIGAQGVAAELSRLLDACLVAQTYSRLVIDCNRPLNSPASMVTSSERTEIPGNRDISTVSAALRVHEIFEPYHRHIAAELDKRARSNKKTILISVHSFTPIYLEDQRPWHIGTLYQHDGRVAHAFIAAAREEGEWNVGDNEPYAVSDTTDYAIPVHGERRGLAHVGLEIRQDLIADSKGQAAWASRIAQWLQRCERDISL